MKPKKIIHKSPTQEIYEDGTSSRFTKEEKPLDWEDKFDKLFKNVSDCHELRWKEESDLGANWEDLKITQNGLKDFIRNLLEKERERIGKEFWKWFRVDDCEMIDDAIPRITGVEDLKSKLK